MEAIRVKQIIKKKGEITIKNLPVNRGQHVEILLLLSNAVKEKTTPLTAQKLKDSGLIGLWKDRKDIQDSSEYANFLRQQAQIRPDVWD